MSLLNVASLSLDEIKKLGFSYVYNSKRDKKNHSLFLKVGLLLLDWANNNGIDFDTSELHLFAKAHCEFWLFTGVSSEQYNIIRSQTLYEKIIQNMGNYIIGM